MSYETKDAEAAARFFQRCRFHTHLGLYGCDDKYVAYFTREGGFADLFRQTLPSEWRVAVGKTADRTGSACIIYDYAREINPGVIAAKLEQFRWARIEANKDDVWITQHAAELKAALPDLAECGAPPPSKGTLLARGTTQGKYGTEFQIRVDTPLDDIKEVFRDMGVELTSDQLEEFCEDLQSRFSDEHGGCGPDVVLDHILETAEDLAADWADGNLSDVTDDGEQGLQEESE